MAKLEVLPEKYLKALSLLESGNHTYREIAKLCKINETDFYDLVEGNYRDSTNIQQKFSDALNDINKRRDKEIRDLIKSNKKETHLLISSWLLDQKKLKKVTSPLMSTLVSVANALSKSTPNVEIGSFSYTKGLSAEDLIHEFRRIKGIAEELAGRRTVSVAPGGDQGEISLVERSGDPSSQEPEDPVL